MESLTWLDSTLRAALAEALTLLLPVDCAGCDEPDIWLCERCALALAPRVTRREHDGIPVWSGLVFEGPPARVVRALKEENRTGLAGALAPALGAAMRHAAAAPDARPTVVPVPTSRASFRRRGFHVVEVVARRAGIPVRRMLRQVRQTGDQRGLGIEQRQRNVAGSLAARGAASGPVIVIDDVLTTGATIAEAVRALRASGCDVVAAVTIAATPRRSGPRETSFQTHR